MDRERNLTPTPLRGFASARPAAGRSVYPFRQGGRDSLAGAGGRQVCLLDYMPSVLRDVRELKMIFASEDPEAQGVWDAADNAWSDQFVAGATENGVARWERILQILPKGTDTLDNRKFRILTRLNERLPYTMRMLRRQLTTLCGEDGYSISVDLPQFILTVKVNLIAKSSFADVGDLLERMVPLNIVIDLGLLYNQHSRLAQYTHAHLAGYTHDQLRNEVIS